MQAARLLIKLCIAVVPLACEAADVKLSVRTQHWSLRAMLLGLERPYAPPVSPQHVAKEKPAQAGTVYVGGVQYHLPPAPARRD